MAYTRSRPEIYIASWVILAFLRTTQIYHLLDVPLVCSQCCTYCSVLYCSVQFCTFCLLYVLSIRSCYQLQRVRGEHPMMPALKSHTLDRPLLMSRSFSYDQGRTQSYSERQVGVVTPTPWQALLPPTHLYLVLPYQQPSRSTREPIYSNMAAVNDEEYMSDCSTASSFTRGSRVRSSLPVMRSTSSAASHLHGIPYTGLPHSASPLLSPLLSPSLGLSTPLPSSAPLLSSHSPSLLPSSLLPLPFSSHLILLPSLSLILSPSLGLLVSPSLPHLCMYTHSSVSASGDTVSQSVR